MACTFVFRLLQTQIRRRQGSAQNFRLNDTEVHENRRNENKLKYYLYIIILTTDNLVIHMY